ncbi:hypothetical protein [Aureimonas flava]|nr:hypothetical protein [Aureimonas flava]
MANLTAVLRKTIDGLPNATPQLRAKVYEKARAAITRQIQAADPPLAPEVAEQRYRVLEDAIAESEAHYQGQESAPPAPAPSAAEAAAPTADPVPPSEAPASPPPPEPAPAPERPAPRPPIPAFARATPTMRAPEPAPSPASPSPTVQPPAAPAFRAPAAPSMPAAPPRAERAEPPVERAPAPSRVDVGPTEGETPQVGVVGPVAEEAPRDLGPAPSAPPPFTTRERRAPADAAAPTGEPRPPRGALRPATPVPASADARSGAPSPGAMLSGIPEADLAAPRYPVRRPQRRKRSPLLAGVAAAGLIGLGALGWIYLDDIRSVVLGSTETASLPAGTTSGQTTDGGETAAPSTGTTPETAAPPSGTATDVAPANPVTTPPAPGGRRFTQRLLADGSEVDEGPGASAPNAFEEGTDVAAATITAPVESPPAAAQPTEPAATTAPTAPAGAPAAASGTVPVGQRAVFYEERSADREGTQQNGNVVWSLVSEPPAEGQPAEPAIRAVVDMPDTNLRMTMTIRRNADTTLPASHVIELMFDTPSGFPGGQIENVQRLALKPTEQARGEPLIGVAGKISDGFFIIALNDLPQAVQSNLALLGREEWIDIPIAYTSGQRALMSIEKGIPGERVFREAIEAWNGRT